MERVQQASLRLAERTAGQLADLWQELTEAQFRLVAAAVVARANALGVTLVDVGVTAEMIRQLRRPVAPLGLRPEPVQVDQTRIATAIERIAGTDHGDTPTERAQSRLARVSRFGADETLLTVATATQRTLRARQAGGWVRMTDPDPCEICVGWADGKVRPTDTVMARHRGCACIQQPVFT